MGASERFDRYMNHLSGDQFGGPTSKLNVVPGNGLCLESPYPNLNQGEYAKWKSFVKDSSQDHPNSVVEMPVVPAYNTGDLTTRPDAFNASHQVDGGLDHTDIQEHAWRLKLRALELQDSFARQVYRPIRERWEVINLHYENMTIDGVHREIFTARFFLNSVRRDFTPPNECIEMLAELQLNQPHEQEEKWTWLEFEMTNEGQYKFEFKYGIPPHIAEEIKYSR